MLPFSSASIHSKSDGSNHHHPTFFLFSIDSDVHHNFFMTFKTCINATSKTMLHGSMEHYIVVNRGLTNGENMILRSKIECNGPRIPSDSTDGDPAFVVM